MKKTSGDQQQKIIAVHLLNNFTGSPNVFALALQALQAKGAEVKLYTSEGPGFLSEISVRHHVTPYTWSPNKYMRLLRFSLNQLLVFFRLLSYWRQPVTFYINTLLPFGAALAGKLTGKKVIYHIHETYVGPSALTRLLRAFVRWTASEAIYVSHYLRDEYLIPGVKSSVVHNAVAEKIQQQGTATREKLKEEFRVIMIASLKKEKGLWELVHLAEALPHIPFTLIIGNIQTEIDHFFGEYVFPPNLILLPAQNNIGHFLSQSDLLLNLSHPIGWPETFGMTILEGMCFGLPAIVPPIGGPLEIVDHGVDGYHIDPRNSEELVQKLRELNQKPQIMALLSDNARKKAEQFSAVQFKTKIQHQILHTN